jgi:hypothetical protein
MIAKITRYDGQICYTAPNEIQGPGGAANTPGRGTRKELLMRREYTPAEVARFWSKVEKQPDGCWVWLASRNPWGYGHFAHRRVIRSAHRCAYEIAVGPIPDGLTIDHLCRNPACVNPAHLEPVTMTENLRRGMSPSAIHARQTHCIHGHPFDASNTYVTGTSKRRTCRTCNRDAVAQYKQRKKARDV